MANPLTGAPAIIDTVVSAVTLPTLTTLAAGDATITLATGNPVGTDNVAIVSFDANVPDGMTLVQPARITATNTIKVRFYNPTANTITPSTTVNAQVRVY